MVNTNALEQEAPVELSQAEIDKQTDEALEAIKKQPHDMQAVIFLKEAIPYRKHLLQKASAAVLRRVSAALDEVPFNETAFVPSMGDERDLYEVGLQIFNAKSILFQKALQDKVTKEGLDQYESGTPEVALAATETKESE